MILPRKEFIEKFKAVSGALSVTESIAIMNIAALAPENGLWVEGGTHKGKSAMSALYGGHCNTFHLIDAEFEKEISTEEVVKNVSGVAKNKVTIALIIGSFQDYLKNSGGRYSFVFSDAGIHDDEVLEECKLLEDKLISGGILCLHDYKNQFCAVERAYDYLLSTGKFEEIEINWEPIFNYVNSENLEYGNSSWHQYPDLPHPPNFVGALMRK